MKKTKFGYRILCAVLCLLMLCGTLVGCGGSGTDGKDGITPVIGANGNWFIGETDTGVKAAGKDGVGIDKIKAELATDANGETYVNFTYEMSDKTVKTVKVPLAQNGQSGQGAYLVPQPVAPDYYAGKKFVFLGDSITCGVGATTAEDRYVNRLVKLLGVENFSNVAVSGTTMSKGGDPKVNDCFWKLTEADCSGADVVTIMLGTNDFSTAVKDGKLYIGDVAVMDTATSDGDVTVAIRPEGFVPDREGPLQCACSQIEIMGRDTSMVCRHPAFLGDSFRAIVDAEDICHVQDGVIRFALKPGKVFLFNKATGERI